jgi:hypothetical protein
MNVNANGEDTEFEDWSHPTSPRAVYLPHGRFTFKSVAVGLLVTAFTVGAIAMCWQIGAIVHAAWRARFG